NQEDGSGNYALVARRAPGTDGPSLALALHRIAARLGEAFKYPAAWDKTRAPAMTPLREHLLAPLRVPLLATLAAMAVLLLIACANVVALSWLPARSLRKSDPQRALSTARTAGIGARGGRTESALVVGQVALAVLLTAGAALLVRSVTNLRAINPGVDTARVAVVDVV